LEACSFRDAYGDFERAGAMVLGISTDSVKKHEKFKSKYGLPQTLLSDPDHQVAEQYGVWGRKKFMGREYDGISRTTFLIDEQGKIKQIWRDVKPEGHADEILAALRPQ
jgi:peroxiredoxin Q/BCP